MPLKKKTRKENGAWCYGRKGEGRKGRWRERKGRGWEGEEKEKGERKYTVLVGRQRMGNMQIGSNV